MSGELFHWMWMPNFDGPGCDSATGHGRVGTGVTVGGAVAVGVAVGLDVTVGVGDCIQPKCSTQGKYLGGTVGKPGVSVRGLGVVVPAPGYE